MTQDIVVPEAQHLKSICAQQRIPRAICRRLILMLTTIDFNNELLRNTDEVDYEPAQRMLTPEFVRTKST
jgi:hypothetical protein